MSLSPSSIIVTGFTVGKVTAVICGGLALLSYIRQGRVSLCRVAGYTVWSRTTGEARGLVNGDEHRLHWLQNSKRSLLTIGDLTLTLLYCYVIVAICRQFCLRRMYWLHWLQCQVRSVWWRNDEDQQWRWAWCKTADGFDHDVWVVDLCLSSSSFCSRYSTSTAARRWHSFPPAHTSSRTIITFYVIRRRPLPTSGPPTVLRRTRS